MMTCVGSDCACAGVNILFGERNARKEYKKYLKKGPHKMTLRLLEALKKENINGMSLIDIGGGVGAIHHTLLSDGLDRAIDVDGSEAYIEKSKEESIRLGNGDKLSHQFGDYVEEADGLGKADIITLDKVLCCYRDMRDLVARSTANATKYYGVIYPVDRWWMKWLMNVGNVLVKLKSRKFKSYIHSTVEVEAIIAGNGFKRKFYYKNLMWQVILYEK